MLSPKLPTMQTNNSCRIKHANNLLRSFPRQASRVFSKLAAEVLELSLDGLEVGLLALDEPGRQLSVVGEAFQGQNINVAKLALRA